MYPAATTCEEARHNCLAKGSDLLWCEKPSSFLWPWVKYDCRIAQAGWAEMASCLARGGHWVGDAYELGKGHRPAHCAYPQQGGKQFVATAKEQNGTAAGGWAELAACIAKGGKWDGSKCVPQQPHPPLPGVTPPEQPPAQQTPADDKGIDPKWVVAGLVGAAAVWWIFSEKS